jgi:hypothetical protein
VQGVLEDDDVTELPGWRVVRRGAGTTVLEGPLSDQPALLGTVARLEGLGCRVRDLYAVAPEPTERQSP